MQKTINDLNSIIQNNELKQLRIESNDLKEKKELLKNISIKVKNVRSFTDIDNNCDVVQITYELPTVKIEFDNGEQLNHDEMFKSINLLDLISLEDKMKIQKELQKTKERSKDNG